MQTKGQLLRRILKSAIPSLPVHMYLEQDATREMCVATHSLADNLESDSDSHSAFRYSAATGCVDDQGKR